MIRVRRASNRARKTTRRRRERAWRSLLLGLPVLGLVATCSHNPTREERVSKTEAMDLLLVTIDTLRADALGVAGNPDAETPVLDRLARGGLLFERAHAHSVLTLPSHTNILTGLLPYQHGVRENSGFRLAEDVPTLAEVLRSEGFATAAFVAAFPLDARFGLARGFDVYDDQTPESRAVDQLALPERSGREVVARALAWWDAQGERRRFAWVHLFEPHAPYRPPSPFDETFADRPYLGEVAAADANLAPLLEPFLDGRRRPATIVVTSDHGEALGEHGELTHGIFAYEPTLRVPLIIWGASIRPGVSRRPARHVDLLPTLVESAGLRSPPGLPGRSLLGPPPAEEIETYFEAMGGYLKRGWAPLRGVIVSDRKYVDLPIPELYDLDADPHERLNLVQEDTPGAAALRRRLPEEDPRSIATAAFSPWVSTQLRSLGYLTSTAPAKARYLPRDDPKNLIHLDRKLQRFSALYRQRRLAEAAALMREVIAERPDMSEPHGYLAQALLEDGQTRAAIEALEGALARGIEDDTLVHQLALAYTWSNRPDEAIALLEPWVGRETPSPETLDVLGSALTQAGRSQEAIAVLERAIALDPSNGRALEGLAAAASAAGDEEKAKGYAERAVALDGRSVVAWNNLGLIRARSGDPKGALAAWQRAVDLDPAAFDSLLNIGVVARSEGRTDLARDALSRFVSSAPPERYGRDLQRARELLSTL